MVKDGIGDENIRAIEKDEELTLWEQSLSLMPQEKASYRRNKFQQKYNVSIDFSDQHLITPCLFILDSVISKGTEWGIKRKEYTLL